CVRSSNVRRGGAVTGRPEWQGASVRAGLGAAGGGPNNRLSVFEEMRMAALLKKVRHLDGTRVPAETAFAMGTRGGAQLLGLEAGEIAPGRLADLVAGDLGHPPPHPRSSLLQNPGYAMSPQGLNHPWVPGPRVAPEQRL